MPDRAKDLLADIVVADVPSDVRATMSEEQLKGVRAATSKRHAFDVRFSVPLFFTKLYFVLLVGRDTRRETVAVEKERRARAGFHVSSFATGVMVAVAVVALFAVVYAVKSRAGINIFPGHLRDYLPFLH